MEQRHRRRDKEHFRLFVGCVTSFSPLESYR